MISRVFEKVYPGIYSGLEECWSKIVERIVEYRRGTTNCFQQYKVQT